MKTPTLRRALTLSLLSAATLTFLPACADREARVIEADKEGIVRADRVDTQDFNVAASKMIQSLYASGALERAARKPAVLAFSRITNDTGEYFDTDLLTVAVIEQLQEGGKVVLKTTYGANKRDSDAGDIGTIKSFKKDKKEIDLPDYTLIGKILKNTARAGDVKQATYTFQLMLTDTDTENTVWIKQTQITKQGSKSKVGL